MGITTSQAATRAALVCFHSDMNLLCLLELQDLHAGNALPIVFAPPRDSGTT